MKVLTVVGARPQFVKAAMTSRALLAAGIDEILVHTGQHYDPGLSDVFFVEMGIPRENYNLAVGSGNHGKQTAKMLEGIEGVLEETRPDWVLVFGDTNSTLAGVLAAVKMHIPTAHVEAGMRSFNRRMPEEINRVVTDHLATLHFCATGTARDNLAREGVVDGVFVVGDVMADAVDAFGGIAGPDRNPALRLGLEAGRYAVMTCHRAENTDDPGRLMSILDGAAKVGADYPVVYPAHPRTKARIQAAGIDVPTGIYLIEPVSYLEMLALTRDAAVALTDSGGLQKEACLLGTPCVTLRDETEWVETVDAGWNVLVGAKSDAIHAAAMVFAVKGAPGPLPPIFGDRRAAKHIVEHLLASDGSSGDMGV